MGEIRLSADFLDVLIQQRETCGRKTGGLFAKLVVCTGIQYSSAERGEQSEMDVLSFVRHEVFRFLIARENLCNRLIKGWGAVNIDIDWLEVEEESQA